MSRYPFISLVKASVRESLRNKAEIFFNLFFPLLFVFIFGNMQRGTDSYHKTRLGLYCAGNVDIEKVISQSGVWETRHYDFPDALIEGIREGDIKLGLIYDGKEARFLYKDGDLATQSKLKLAQLSIISALEKHVNHVNPILSVSRVNVSAGKIKASGMDYTLAGIISIAILSVGLMSVVSMFGRYRKSGVLNQLKIAPLRPMSFVFGITISRIILSFLSLILILGASIIFLGAGFQVNWLMLSITMLASTLGMMALGLLLVLTFHNPETANTSAGILMFVMHFLAGVFFPVALLPGYMKAISAFLPLKYVSILVRHSLGIELIPEIRFAILSVSLALGGILMLWLTGKKYLSSSSAMR